MACTLDALPLLWGLSHYLVFYLYGRKSTIMVQICFVCGCSEFSSVRGKLHCEQCHSIVEVCCEGSRSVDPAPLSVPSLVFHAAVEHLRELQDEWSWKAESRDHVREYNDLGALLLAMEKVCKGDRKQG